MTYDKILVPTDGSKAAVDAADEAFDLADQLDAEVLVVSVVEDALVDDKIYGNPPADVERVREIATNATEDLVEEAESRGIDADPVVVQGSPASEVIEQAEKSGADMIAMGTHGRSGLDRVLLGSVADKVVRQADVPVLTIRPD